MTDEHNDATDKQRTSRERSNANLRPFQKGDVRINRKGRPKDFNALRRLAQQVSVEVVPSDSNVNRWTRIETILRQWASSGEPTLQKAFVEIAYGKVPNPVEVSGKDGGPIETKDVTPITDEKRIEHLAAIFDAARTRRDRQADSGPDPA